MSATTIFDLEKALVTLPVGQKRTRSHGQWVFFEGERIVKGPYTAEFAQLIIYRSAKMKEWQTPLIVHPLPEVLQDIHGGIYLTFPNLAYGYPEKTTPYSENFKRGKNYSYNVLVRNTLVKMGDHFNEPWLPQYFPHIMLSWLHQYVLGIGDIGPANVLLDLSKQQVYVIDYDQTRGKLSEGDFFYLPRDMAKAKAEIWLPVVKPYYEWAINELLSLRQNDATITNEILTLLDDAVTKLRALSGISSSQTDITSNDEIVLQYVPMNVNTGLMENKGPFGGTTGYSGYKMDEMKSAMQKYIRRNMPEKALHAMVEMDRLLEVATPKYNTISMQSNMYNRLAVIAAEDIGPAHFPLATACIDYVLNTRIVKGQPMLPRDPYVTSTFVSLLATSAKTRVMSHLWTVYATDEGMNYALNIGIDVNDSYDETATLAGTSISLAVLENEDATMLQLLAMIKMRLQESDARAVYWLSLFLDYINVNKVKLQKRVRRRTRPEVLLYDIFRIFYPEDVVSIYETAFFTFSEKRPFFMCIFTAILYRTPYTYFDVTPYVQEFVANNDDYLKVLYSGVKRLVLDDYVFDKHTKRGREMGMGRQEFVTDGAYVQPRSEYYHNEVWARIYEES